MNEEKTQIWVITRLYHPNFSGASIQAHQILKRLVHKGFSVTVLTPGQFAANSLRGQRIRRDGIGIWYLRTLRHARWISVADIRRVRRILPYIRWHLGVLSFGILAALILWREGGPDDIVRVYSPDAFSFLPVWVAKLKGMHPVLHMTLLNSDDPGSIKGDWNKLFGALKQESFNRAEAITGYSSAQIQSCVSAGLDSRKLFQIPGGVDLRRFRQVNDGERFQLRKKLGLKPDSRFIVFVGNAIARKGLDVLIKAFVDIYSIAIGSELLIVGPYDLSDPAYKLARELQADLHSNGLSSYVHWIGSADNVHDYMRASDIFCLPSRNEGFGIVIAEAMAAGLPVVASRLEGVTTDLILSNREGILVRGHDYRDYAKALLGLLEDPAKGKAMGNAARARAETEFNLAHAAERYARLYRELIGLMYA